MQYINSNPVYLPMLSWRCGHKGYNWYTSTNKNSNTYIHNKPQEKVFVNVLYFCRWTALSTFGYIQTIWRWPNECFNVLYLCAFLPFWYQVSFLLFFLIAASYVYVPNKHIFSFKYFFWCWMYIWCELNKIHIIPFDDIYYEITLLCKICCDMFYLSCQHCC